MTSHEIAEEIKTTLRDMDEQRAKLSRALALLEPDAKVIPLRRKPGPKPGSRRRAA